MTNEQINKHISKTIRKMPIAVQAENQIPSFFRQIGNQLDVADSQRKLKLVFQPGFLQHI